MREDGFFVFPDLLGGECRRWGRQVFGWVLILGFTAFRVWTPWNISDSSFTAVSTLFGPLFAAGVLCPDVARHIRAVEPGGEMAEVSSRGYWELVLFVPVVVMPGAFADSVEVVAVVLPG
ncbi:hypothetical protein [Streptomyces sp. NPDC096142]|uniref:hypothetical protein n=1 Tax=Streptomyces sp. NPDC096142 TaxID=3366077 RepID=UPI003820410C